MSVNISADRLPTIDRAGQYPLLNPVHDFTYRNPTNALHLYDYHARIRIGSGEHMIHPGDITCIQAGTVYSLESEHPGKHWCIHYFDTPESLDRTIALPTLLHLGVNSRFYLEQMRHISRLWGSVQNRAEHDALTLEACFRLKSLLLSLHNLGRSGTAGQRSRMNFAWDELLNWIDANLCLPLSVPLLAERANTSPATLSRKFRQEYRMTLIQYLLQRRIGQAKSLLSTTSLTICEVGAAVGIPDPQYFNKQFRKVAGMSPCRYRDNNREYLALKKSDEAVKDGLWQPSGSASPPA